MRKFSGSPILKGLFTRYDLSARFIGPTASKRKSCVDFDSRWTTDSWKWKSVRLKKNLLQCKRFFEVGPTLREKAPCQSKGYASADGTIYRPDKTGRQIVPCKPAFKKRRPRRQKQRHKTLILSTGKENKQRLQTFSFYTWRFVCCSIHHQKWRLKLLHWILKN